MSSTQLMVPAWEKDMVYLVQFPRMGNVPSLSPFALKAETWLRMAKVPYKNVNNNLKRMSSKGQIPFVEVNGREIADSNHIMDELKKLFDLDIDKNLSDRDWADMMAYHSLIEDTLRWQDWYFRTKDARYILEADGQPQWNFVTGLFVKYWMMPRFMKEYQGRCVAQGVGRETPEEVIEGAKRNLKAVSNFIGEKHYILGDKPTSLDATAFGHLLMFYYRLGMEEFKDYMDKECKLLVDYLMRLKEEFWKDWDVVVTTHTLDSTNDANVNK